MYNKEFEKCWLDYQKIDAKRHIDDKFISIYSDNAFRDEKITDNAVFELQTAWKSFFGKELCLATDKPEKKYIYLKIFSADDSDYEASYDPGDEGYIIYFEPETEILVISAKTPSGILYGTFDLIRNIIMGTDLSDMKICSKPEMNIRMIDHWDNMKGDIERGYSGDSFFYEDNKIIFDDRTRMYARMMASIGINAITINNVNVHYEETFLITDKHLPIMKKYSDLFNSYGIKLYLSINFASPVTLGVTEDCDPLNSDVIAWWKKTSKHIYEVIPNFGGFLVKADSEGRPGPHTYGRTQADGANMLARTIKDYGGIVVWRCFVYNCRQDWRDRKTDRARAAYDNFADLDGAFDDNVILQIKNGPVDFQVREPVSPLFGAMKKTNLMLEAQIAQEYTGQQIDICYLVPMWKEILDFNTYAVDGDGKVKDIISGKTYGNSCCGMAGVTNTGCDANWTGHDFAAANLFGYGMLCWDTSLSAEHIAKMWIRCTFGFNEKINDVIWNIIKDSWHTYEKYTSPLGIGWLLEPLTHYGPNVNGFEYSVWGTYHRADCKGMGVERNVESGTGFAGQYNKPLCDMYEHIETTPTELLLFFHRLEYDHILPDGRTLIQYIYDTHFEGVIEVEEMIEQFRQLKGVLDDKRYDRITERLNRQYKNAIEWRDLVNTFFYRMSGINDEKGRTIY